MKDTRLEKSNNMKRAIELAKMIYDIHCVGGHFHIVLDDGNLEDNNIRWCVSSAFEDVEDSEIFYIYQELGSIMLNMSKSQRLKLYEKYNEYGGVC